jgi:hypothetical protein
VANEVEICNVALSRVGAGTIQALTDKTREGQLCRIHYPIARDSVLRDHDWNFARKVGILAELNETYDGWDYVYQYPLDCLIAREIYNEAKVSQHDNIPFEVGLTANNNRCVLTNEAQARLYYTAYVTNATYYDAAMVEALTWKLAAELAVPAIGRNDLQDIFMRAYIQYISRAKMLSSNEGYEAPNLVSDFSRARA